MTTSIARATGMAILCLGTSMLAVRGATPSAFERRCIPSGCVAPPSNIPDIAPHRAQHARWGPRRSVVAPFDTGVPSAATALGWSSGRIAALGATMDLHHGLLGAADPPRGAFGIGVLRRDSVVVPFASFDGKRWSSPWPPPNRELTVPINLRAVPSRWWGPTPALESWQAWTAASPLTLRVVQPDWVDVHCVRQIGLRTDYRPPTPPPPRTEQPYPKDGLAVSPPQPIDRAEILPSSADEVRSFMPVLTQAFNQAERLVEDRYGHPIARRAREGVEPRIEAVYAFGAAPRVYYVEAGRLYRQLGQSLEDCTAFGFGTGWFVRDEAGVRPLNMAVDLLPCDRSGASYMLPLGVMRLAGRLFWIAQFSGWDHERFVVVEIKPKTVEVAVNVWGGGC